VQGFPCNFPPDFLGIAAGAPAAWIVFIILKILASNRFRTLTGLECNQQVDVRRRNEMGINVAREFERDKLKAHRCCVA
jgi:hypothetical protein